MPKTIAEYIELIPAQVNAGCYWSPVNHTDLLAWQAEHDEYLPEGRSKCDNSLDELAESQNVKPMTDVRALSGTWPGEKDDGFEEAIDELRHPDTQNP